MKNNIINFSDHTSLLEKSNQLLEGLDPNSTSRQLKRSISGRVPHDNKLLSSADKAHADRLREAERLAYEHNRRHPNLLDEIEQGFLQ